MKNLKKTDYISEFISDIIAIAILFALYLPGTEGFLCKLINYAFDMIDKYYTIQMVWQLATAIFIGGVIGIAFDAGRSIGNVVTWNNEEES